MAVRVRVSMVNKDERNYVITLDKEKSTCTLVRFFILPTRLKFNYHQFCFNITRYNHYTFGASSLFKIDLIFLTCFEKLQISSVFTSTGNYILTINFAKGSLNSY